jgi:RHS repeat-associated protein
MNELTSASRSGTLTVAGSTTEPGNKITGVTVDGQSANVYADGTFAAAGFTPANGNNTFTAVAQDTYGRQDSQSITAYLPATPSYSYDANGNLLSDGTRNFAYDDENQLVAVWVANSWSNNFAYDGLLRKRIEKDYSWNGSSWLETNEVHFVYDGYLVLQERNAANLPQVTYTRGFDLSGSLQGAGGIGGLLARTDMGKFIVGDPQASAYYFSDAQGNVKELFYPAGPVAANYEYDPYGNLLVKSGPLADANRYRFSSKEWNDNAGLYYYGFRFYDPNLQRWPNRDPIQEWGGWNLYSFCLNSPFTWDDILGWCGNLTIYSSGTHGLGNHSWISFTPDGGKTTTYGTYGNHPPDPNTGQPLPNGVEVNYDAGRTDANATRTEHLTDAQQQALFNTINHYEGEGQNAWSYGAPCSTFACQAWNNATGEHLSPYWGPISNPTSLTHSITKANGGVANGTATGATGESLGNSSAESANSSSSSSANSSVTPSADSCHASGSF